MATLGLRADPPAAIGGAGWDGGYIGADACGICHADEYADWLATPHARAHELLPESRRADPACTSCHQTGAEPHLAGVQCESCHGPGADYWPEYVMRDPHLARAVGLRPGDGVAGCARCHSAETPRIEAIEFQQMLRRVDHSGDRPS